MEAATIQARMTSPVQLIPGAFKAMQALSESARATDDLPQRTIDLVQLRASQINGCSFCAEMHSREARERGETDERLFTVAAWREAPYFNEAERAALALTEAATRLSDRADAVPDEIWEGAKRHYDEQALAALLIQIAAINAWNRLNVPIRNPAGSYRV
jgi:AhpD family alkylhydroperoxidase